MGEVNNRSWFAQMTNGIIQNVIASVLLLIVGGGLSTIGWVKAENLYDPSSWPIWVMVFGTLMFVAGGARTLWLVWRKWFAQERISRPFADRIGILVAQFEGDADNLLQETIMDNLGKELGKAANVTKWPDALVMGDGVDHDRARKSDKTAQKWLNKKHNDVLVWGRRKSDGVVSLRFTARDGVTTDAATHRLTEDLDLPESAIAQLGGVIAVQAASLAAPAVDQAGIYLAPKMREISDRLKPFADYPPASFDANTRAWLRFSFALARQTLGEQTGHSSYLEEAIVGYRAALDDWHCDKVPLFWAITQNNLGNALCALGAKDLEPRRLEEAIEAYCASLQIKPDNGVALDWAMTQDNLGIALMVLGKREPSSIRLEESLRAHRSALQMVSREKTPLLWANFMHNLAGTLRALGEREEGSERLEEAVMVFRSVLEVRKRDLTPLKWAKTQTGLGGALQILGNRSADIQLLTESVAAFHAALGEQLREQVPLAWAGTQYGLGIALRNLGEIESDAKWIRQSIDAFSCALAVRTKEKGSLDWADTQNSLANSFCALGEIESDPISIRLAIDVYRELLEEFTKADATHYMGKTHNNLALAEAALTRLLAAK